MKKIYAAPKLINHATVAEMTKYFGNGPGDTFKGPDGNTVATGTGSINACATQTFQTCTPAGK